MARKRSSFFRRIQSFLKPGLMPFLSLAIALSLVLMPMASISISSVPSTENLLQQGKSLYDRARYDEAVELLQQAVSVFEERRDKLGMAIALSNLSLTYQQLGRWHLAELAITNSLNLLPAASSTLDLESAQILAQTLDIKGRLELKKGQARAALDTWQQTTDLYRQLEDEAGIVRSQLNQAQAMSDLGMYFQAEKILTKTVRLLQDQPVSSLKATALRSLGSVYRELGDLDRSRQILEQSLAVATESIPTGDILLSLGNTARAQAQTIAALDFYEEAVENAPDISTRIQAQLNRLNLLVDEANPQAALHLADRIESQLKSLPPSHKTIYARINLAENLQQLRRDNIDICSESKLLQILTEARQQARELNDTPAISYALGNLAEVYAQSGQLQQAIDLTRQALYRGQTVNNLNLTYRWQWQLGRLQKEAGNTTEAIAAYTEAVNSLQDLRTNLVALDPKVQFYFRQRVEPVYRELVDLLLKSQPSQADLVLARQTIESLQLAELENFFRQACLEPKVEIDDLVEGDTTAVIYPIVLADRLEIIVKLPQSQLLHFTTPVRRDEFETTTATLRDDLLDVTKTAAVKQRSQLLYRWSIEPMATALTQNQTQRWIIRLNYLTG